MVHMCTTSCHHCICCSCCYAIAAQLRDHPKYLTIKTKYLVCCQEYIHRVGRTARGEGGTGNAIILLRPEEMGFLLYLKKQRVIPFDMRLNKPLLNIQHQVSRGLNIKFTVQMF